MKDYATMFYKSDKSDVKKELFRKKNCDHSRNKCQWVINNYK